MLSPSKGIDSSPVTTGCASKMTTAVDAGRYPSA